MPYPKISVIVPVYNAEKYLNRCIDSILAQTFTDFELLLIDDGSKDCSGQICDKYAVRDSRVRVFHKPNGGVSSARNLGLDNAHGEWICFCDADDYVLPEWLDNYNVEHSNKYDLICQGFRTDKPLCNIENNIKYSYSIAYEGNANQLHEFAYDSNMFGYLWVKAFRTDIIISHKIRFDSQITLKEDEIFLLDYSKYCRKCKSVLAAGYYYFVPDWNSKYCLSFKERVYLLEREIKALKSIKVSLSSNLYHDTLSALTDEYIKEYYNVKNIEYLKCVRKVLKDNFMVSKVNFPTRLIICIDATMLFSRIWMSFYFFLIKDRYCDI